MKPTPPGWPRISQALYYEDAAKAIDFLRDAFGFEVKMKVVGEGGRIEHSELVYGEGLVMVGDVAGREEKYPCRRSPSQVHPGASRAKGIPQAFTLFGSCLRQGSVLSSLSSICGTGGGGGMGGMGGGTAPCGATLSSTLGFVFESGFQPPPAT